MLSSLGGRGEQTLFSQAVAVNREISKGKKKFPPPSVTKRRRTTGQQTKSKVTSYVRDILCLPKTWTKDDSRISIPRGDRRSYLAESGLIGKIEFNSDMSDKEVRTEICKAFSQPMGLTSYDLERGNLFSFQYLQRTGSGARTLCIPSVSENFQWNGKQVSTLAKSGGIIYILAQTFLISELYDQVIILNNIAC